MAFIGNLLAGAGVQTVFAGRAQMDQYILLGDVDTANVLQSIQVEVDGQVFLNIANAQNLVTAYAKWLQNAVLEVAANDNTIGVMFKIGTGQMKRSTTYRFTNSGVTTPAIFAFSTDSVGVPFVAATKTINANDYEDFSRFSALFIQTPANVDSLEVVFRRVTDGGKVRMYKETMQIVEADALFNFFFSTETNGRLGGVSVIDNTSQSIESVRINTNAGAGGTTVLAAKLPDEAFKILKKM